MAESDAPGAGGGTDTGLLSAWRQWLRHLCRPLPLSEVGVMTLAVVATLMLPGSPVSRPRFFVALAAVVGLWFLGRRMVVILPTFLVGTVALRLHAHGSFFEDQHFYQWFSLSTLPLGSFLPFLPSRSAG